VQLYNQTPSYFKAGFSMLYRDYNTYLRELFGCRVHKITVDSGLTCPNRDGSRGYGGCIYCNAKGSGTGAFQKGLTISEQIQDGKAFLGRRYKAKKFLAYFQSFTNTYAPFPLLKSLYAEALQDEDVVGLTIGTRPDCVSDELLDHLSQIASSHLVWLEYGLQSSNDETLKRIRRGHTVEDFKETVRRTRARNIPICAHVILGLPGEGRKEMLETARFIASGDIQAVKIHLLYVIYGTVLEEWYRGGEYSCLTREEYTSIVGEFLSLLPPDMIVQRLTGDPHPEELVAPQWAMEKHKNIECIRNYLVDNGLYQGRAYSA
jgi:uncharacterized protein